MSQKRGFPKEGSKHACCPPRKVKQFVPALLTEISLRDSEQDSSSGFVESILRSTTMGASGAAIDATPPGVPLPPQRIGEGSPEGKGGVQVFALFIWGSPAFGRL
jgi:hypothetical protein